MSDRSMAHGAGSSSGKRVWYRSLYWRIALGLIAFLALMLTAQGLLFIWMTERVAGSMPARSPRRLAVLVASDLSAALARDPRLDLQKYVTDQFSHVFQPFVVLMDDGRVAANRMPSVAPQFEQALRAQAHRGERGAAEIPREPPGREVERDGSLEPRRAVRLRRRSEFASIVVGGRAVGVVAVMLGRPPFTLLLQELGPPMTVVGGLVLVIGTTLIALVVFGPARKRLRQLQHATIRLGAGDLSARAPAHGGDEVAELAQSFNRMAEDLAARAQALEASDRARRQLLADVSHELMTPLTAMRGYIETLSMSELQMDGSTRERYLRIVDEETQRLERMIGDLLDLARLEGGGQAMRHERVDVAALFDRVAMRHERDLAGRRIRLTRTVEPGAESVAGDPDRLEQALQNLAANALRHTPEGGEVALHASRNASGVHIVVRDTGPGIPTDHLPLIFDRFYKVDAARKASGGSGLGLSIVKAIVERHGGTIAARNDGGAVFEIILPAVSQS